MKKLVFLSLMFLGLSLNSKAEQVVGTYSNAYFGKTFEIEAAQENNKLESVYIGVEAAGSKTAFISVDGKDLELFKTSLELVRDKYVEWVKIAKENNVKDMHKEFGIKFPSVTVAWYGSKWWFSFNKKVNMKFSILDSGRMVAVWYAKVTSSSNEYIDEKIYFVFEGEDDFNNLINQLNYSVILDKLLNTKKAEELFK